MPVAAIAEIVMTSSIFGVLNAVALAVPLKTKEEAVAARPAVRFATETCLVSTC